MTRRTQIAAGLDLLAILLFALVGRFNHNESLVGAPLTALPFVLGAVAGWSLVRFRSGQDPLTVGPGITVWVCTTVIGLVLRAIFGGGTALSFIIVSALVLGLLMVGWRLVAERLEADRAETPADEVHDVDA